MTKTTNSRQLRLFIQDVYNSYGEPIPAGFEFYLVDAVMKYVRSVYEDNESPVTVRERLTNAMFKGAKRAATLETITDTIKKKLNINPSEEFAEFAYNKSKHGEDIETFCTYWLENGGEPTYWSEKRMMMLWPQAFTQTLSYDEQLAKAGYK